MAGQRDPRLIENWTSTSGIVVAGVSTLVILFFLVVRMISHTINPYVGILIYIVLPAILIAGLILIPLGIFFEWRRRQRTGLITYRRWPSLDLNDPAHRRAVLIFLIGSLSFILLSTVGMYQAYHYTESVQFCGLTCHRVMKPEYTAYQDSPHARVRCVNCHIGPGAGWYARSKLSGLYQVYAVARDIYPRPIPTPIEDLRPARETCETCHWPRQFFGSKQRRFDHYRYDRKNSPWPIEMLIKIGGGSPKTSQTAGIHWHMNIAVKVEYIARDKRRQEIPWVRVTEAATGRISVYQDRDNPLSPKELAESVPRVMDCMDCHNRPSHDFQSPDHAIDLALATGRMDAQLPEIKSAAVDAMIKEYPGEAEALRGIAAQITDFYRLRYPEVAAARSKAIQDAIIAVQSAYARNIFPFMQAKWSAYPNDIGHFIFPGCMRCHDGKHANSSGIVISNDCRACHSILAQGPEMTGRGIIVGSGLDFLHPVDIGDAAKQGQCYQCHTGVRP